jgi:hypothetical protein
MTIVSSLLLSSLLLGCGESDKEGDAGDATGDLDNDGDGLTNAEEAELGTDPDNADSDGDTYWDSWELDEGTDPTDPDNRIYTGYWPYQPDKDSYPQSDGSDFTASQWDAMPRVTLLDQWGDEVDIHDFAGQGKYIMLDVSAIWCGPCNGLASWLSGGRDDYGFNSAWPEVKELVEDGHVYWLTVLVQDNQGNTPDLADIEAWYDDYPDPHVPVLADDGTWINVAPAYPSMYLFTEEMELYQGPGGVNHYKPMDVLVELYEEIVGG